MAGTEERKDMRVARPKNLATKTVALACACGFSIHTRQCRSMQSSLQPFRRTRQPLQLMILLLLLLWFIYWIQLNWTNNTSPTEQNNLKLDESARLKNCDTSVCVCVWYKVSILIRKWAWLPTLGNRKDAVFIMWIKES